MAARIAETPSRERTRHARAYSRHLYPRRGRSIRRRIPVAGLLEHFKLIGCFDDDSVGFMTSGMGNETYFPPSLHHIPPAATHAEAIREAHMLFFPALDDLFAKIGVPLSSVGVVVVNCNGFCATPSLSAIIDTACPATSRPAISLAWAVPRAPSASTSPQTSSGRTPCPTSSSSAHHQQTRRPPEDQRERGRKGRGEREMMWHSDMWDPRGSHADSAIT
uniref:FAE domain-containing protein n=1 Tax=Oryza rufipogon TaxID=4529 RepID=A0A0E0NS77_ORYRU